MALKNHNDEIFITEHKTNILPLRWLANYIFHPVSMWFFRVGLNANDRYTYEWHTYKFRHSLMEKIGYWMYYYLDKPYQWWGTIYVFKMPDDFKLNDSLGWDDYDDRGIPYWYYLWSEDPETGDAWRLVLDKSTQE